MFKFFFSHIILLFLTSILDGCNEPMKEAKSTSKNRIVQSSLKTIGKIERIDAEINEVIPENTVIEVLSDSFVWLEGPLWIGEKQWLLFSDVKTNRIYKWSERDGVKLFLEPSGFTGVETDSREKGSNGLALDAQGNLTICQHGNRQVVKMNATLENPKPDFIPIASKYKGKKFNSPNDLVYDSKDNLYFTDPPYGLSEALMDDPKKELSFQGIYKVNTSGEIVLLTDKVSRPNGLAFSPDEKTLYVANTDDRNAAWLAFSINDDGTLGVMTEILNVTNLIGKEQGFPDGIKVDNKGNIFTAGPGGLWIFNSKHELIGKIKPGEWVSNCAFDDDFKNLYITADDHLLRVRLNKMKK